jgi:hypothetical protein
MLTARFPRLAYLRFVPLEDEIGDEREYVGNSQLALYGDTYFEAVCRSPDNGHAAFLRRSEFPELRANDVRVSSVLVCGTSASSGVAATADAVPRDLGL